MPWQQYVADVALEQHPDGSLVYDQIGLEVGRQEGKTELKFVICVMRLTVMTLTHGPQVVTYTMQDRASARKRLERVYINRLKAAEGFRYLDPRSRQRPSKITDWRPGLNSGVEHLQFGGASYLQIDTPSGTGGHGDTLDAGMIDEAFAHEDATVENNMEPAMIARRDTQLWWMSAAGTAKSRYLWRKITTGRKLVNEGWDEGTAYFEWSADDDANPADPAVWAACCPAMGFTIDEATIEARYRKALAEGPEQMDKFRRSYLSQWPEVPVLEQDYRAAGFDVDSWLVLADPSAERGSRVVFGVDVGSDRLAHVAVVWRRPDRRIQVMLADTGLSPLRTPDRLAQLAQDWKGPVMLGGPSTSLEGDVRQAKVLSSSEFAAACGRFDDLLSDDQIRHGNQPALNAAVAAAEWRPYGTAGERTLRLRDAADVGPLAAVARAIYGLELGGGTPATPIAERATASAAPVSETADLSTMQF